MPPPVIASFHKKGGEKKHTNLKKKGQGLVENALILVLVAIVVIIVLTVLGSKVNKIMSEAASSLH